MKHLILATTLLALSGCAQFNADHALSVAVESKQKANDLQARAISAALCDLSLGGLDQLTQDLAWLALEECTDLERRIVVEQFVVPGPSGEPR